MLFLTRKKGESIIINESIEIHLIEVRGKTAKLGLSYPQGTRVLRRELYDRIQTENEMALQESELLVEWLTATDNTPPIVKRESK